MKPHFSQIFKTHNDTKYDFQKEVYKMSLNMNNVYLNVLFFLKSFQLFIFFAIPL